MNNESFRPCTTRRVATVFLLGLLLFVLYGNRWSPLPPQHKSSLQKEASPNQTPPQEITLQMSAPPPRWKFDAARDRDNHSLTYEQCDIAFPRLYQEIDRSAEFWRRKLGGKTIQPDMVNLRWSGDGGMTAMIHDNQIYVTHSRGLNHFKHWEERSKNTLLQIERAVRSSREPIPDIEFSIKINDIINLDYTQPHDNVTVWAFSRNVSDPITEQAWLIPDFNFWNYPRVAPAFSHFQQQAIAVADDKFANKRDQLVWRGTVGFRPELRWPLIMQTAGQRWSDVHQLDTELPGAKQDQHHITMPEHCRSKYSVHTEGTSWSGRLKYLVSCHQVVFIHNLTYYTHLYHLLTPSGPDQNYVPVQNDWSDLPQKMEEMIADQEKAKMIADNAARDLRDRYFTPAAQSCYWRRLFRVWKEATYEPDPYEYIKVGENGGWEKRIRGMSLEEYLFYDGSVPAVV